MKHRKKQQPPWSWGSMIDLLCRLARAAKTKSGRRIITEDRLLSLWDENRVRLLIAHEVSFSLECRECDGCASGDGITTLEQAIDEGWTEIMPASPENPLSHFEGQCPEHSKRAAKAKEAANG